MSNFTVKEYYKGKKGKKSVYLHQRCKDCTRKDYRKWYTKNGRNRAINYQEKIIEWAIKHPKELKAKYLVNQAIKKGKIIKPKLCFICNLEKRLCGHHQNYNKPLEVIWMCFSCHKLEHIKKKNEMYLTKK